MNKDGWTLMKVGDFATECREKNKNNAYSEVRTVSARMGIVNQTYYFNNEVASKDVSGYKVVRKHNFAYRPMGIDIGTLGMSEESEPVLVSPAYVVFKVDETVCRSKYLLYYLKSQDGSNQLNSLLEPGIRIRFPFSYMAKVTIPVPSLQEQDEIIESLSHLDSLISVKGGEVSLMTNMKQQLMNDIFNTSTDGLQRETWRKVKLGDLCSIDTGEFIRKDKQVDSGEYPVYNGGVTNTGMHNEYNREGPAIIISARGSAGYVNMVEGKYWAGNSLYSIKPLRDDVDFKYLYYVVKSNQEKLQGMAQSSTLPAVNKGQVAELEIILPPLSIQHKISSILSAYDSLILATDDKSSNLRLAKQQLMNNIFSERESNSNLVFTDTWRKVKLGDICKIRTGRLNANAAVENGQYPFFTCAEEVSRIDTYAFDCDAILISGNGSQLGHVHTYNGKFNAYQRTYVLDDFKDVDKKYLEQYIKIHLPDRIKESLNGGAVPYIRLDCLSDMEIIMPSLPEQLQISSILSDYDMLIESERESENILRKAKTQLMSEIFNRV